jgi:hypothetical protein
MEGRAAFDQIDVFDDEQTSIRFARQDLEQDGAVSA